MNGRILHLATDDKFLDHACVAFEEVAPGQSEYLVYSAEEPVRIAATPYVRIDSLHMASPRFYARFADYRFVVLHSLRPLWVDAVNKAPAGTTFVWLGWGFDYYDLLPGHHPLGDLLLDKTRQVCDGIRRERRRYPAVLKAARRALQAALFKREKRAAMKRIALFAPVLHEDYAMLAQAVGPRALPPYISWNYGSLEGVLLQGIGDATVAGNSILLGNNALPSNNHEDAFELLGRLGPSVRGRKIITPLSYGERSYAARIAESGRSELGEDFVPLLDFMRMEDYTRTLSTCSHVIMNQRRQQALGSIVIMLHLGATVFLREESPTYAFFKSHGTHLWSVQELERNPALIEKRLTMDQVEQNRAILRAHWSRETILTKTRRLIEAGDASPRHRVTDAGALTGYGSRGG